MGEINERIYGINPFEKSEEEMEKLLMEERSDLEELAKDNYYGR